MGIGGRTGLPLPEAGRRHGRRVGQILERQSRRSSSPRIRSASSGIWQDLFALTYTSVRGIPTLAQQRRQLVTAISAIDIALWDLDGQGHEPTGSRAARRRAPLSACPRTSPASTIATASVPDDLRREAATIPGARLSNDEGEGRRPVARGRRRSAWE